MKKKQNYNKTLIASLSLNVILAALALVLVLNKLGVLTRESVGVTNYSYLNNPQYEANYNGTQKA